MEQQDQFVIAAFLITLSKLDASLDITLQQKVNELGQRFSSNTKSVIPEIFEIATSHTLLKQLYNESHSTLIENYTQNTRNKSIGERKSLVDESKNREIENITFPIEKILCSQDSVNEAKKCKSSIENKTTGCSDSEMTSSQENDDDKPDFMWVEELLPCLF